MVSLDSKHQFLIDPELLVPDENNIDDPVFWQRLLGKEDKTGASIIKKLKEYGLLGYESGKLLDVFLLELWEYGSDWFQLIDIQFNMNDIFTLINDISGIQRLDNPDERITATVLSESDYCPKRGSSKCRLALESDISTMANPSIIADRDSWPAFSTNASTDGVDGIAELFNYSDEIYLCARAIISANLNYESCFHFSDDAFPRIVFCKGAKELCRHFLTNEMMYAPKLLVFFSGLNDYACDVWRQTKEYRERRDRLDAVDVDCSPEKQETMAIESCRDERSFILEGEPDPIVMSWHLKFEHDAGRMYFKVDIDKDRVVIGGNTRHFSTTKAGKRRKNVRHKGRG